MKALNLGCGPLCHSDWINLDIVPSQPEVKSWDAREQLPFLDQDLDYCYSSHLLEHLSPATAQMLVSECFRVLKSRGVVRVVVPDLELIARNYLYMLEQVESGVLEAIPSYDWMMLELYDQVTRSFSGGEMGRYLMNLTPHTKEFVAARIGLELDNFLDSSTRRNNLSDLSYPRLLRLLKKLKTTLIVTLVGFMAGMDIKLAFEEGLFRQSGEIHKWMYDRFSLRRLLEQAGFAEIKICRADESQIPNFNKYELDVIQGKVRKPDSLFMEGVKP